MSATTTPAAPATSNIDTFANLLQSWNESVRTPELSGFPQVTNTPDSLLEAGAQLLSSYRRMVTANNEADPDRIHYFAAAMKVCDKLATAEPDLARGLYEQIYHSAPKHLAPLSPLLELPAPEGDDHFSAECRDFFNAVDKLNLSTTTVAAAPAYDYIK